MGIILDIVLLAVLILSIFWGYKKGLVGVAFNLCAFIVAIIITWMLYTPITNAIIENTEFDDGIRNTIIEKGVIKSQDDGEKNGKQDGVNDYIQKYVTTAITNTTNNVVEETAKVVSEKVVAIVVIIGLFIVVRIGLILLKFVIEGIAKLPIIKQFNKVGGSVYGAIRGMFVIYVFLAILFFVMSVNNSGMIAGLINTSLVSKYLYANNLILNLIF